jgi:hypothetical protein
MLRNSRYGGSDVWQTTATAYSEEYVAEYGLGFCLARRIRNRYVMTEYKILKVGEYNNYTVEDARGVIRTIGLEWHDIDHPPQEGDCIRLSDKYFDKEANEGLTFFSFGGLSGIYGRDVSNENLDESEEIIIILQENDKIYLKRFYG